MSFPLLLPTKVRAHAERYNFEAANDGVSDLPVHVFAHSIADLLAEKAAKRSAVPEAYANQVGRHRKKSLAIIRRLVAIEIHLLKARGVQEATEKKVRAARPAAARVGDLMQELGHALAPDPDPAGKMRFVCLACGFKCTGTVQSLRKLGSCPGFAVVRNQRKCFVRAPSSTLLTSNWE